jgi:hypothetical protein
MDIQQPFIKITDEIQNEIGHMSSKTEILTFLDMLSNFVSISKKLTRTYMKGMR